MSTMAATKQLKEMLSLLNAAKSSSQMDSRSELNNLNLSKTVMAYNLPNNCTLRVGSSSRDSLFTIIASKIAIEGRESTNSYYTKIERLVDFHWDPSSPNLNLIAVNIRLPLIAYVINTRQFSSPKASPNVANQVVRVMNYDTRRRCLAKGTFRSQIADLAFAINAVTCNALDLIMLAVADKMGNVYIYRLKEDNGELSATRVLEIINDSDFQYDYVRLVWCPYIPDENDDNGVDGDPGLRLALSCNTRVQMFAIDILHPICRESNLCTFIEVSKLNFPSNGYQVIEKAHQLPIISLSIAQDVTAICTTGLDDKIIFYKTFLDDASDAPKMLKEWTPKYLEGDHINCFYFLDDFDFLLRNSDQTFWGYAIIGSKRGHISIVDLKDWRCRQSIQLVCEESANSSDCFNYRLDLTSHFLIAVHNSNAFILHIRFPHDKEEENYSDSQTNDNFEFNINTTHPFISKVSRFQIYNAPLRSFCVRKSDDGNVLIFWITSSSLELCHVNLNLINVDELYDSPFEITSAGNLIETIEDSNDFNPMISPINVTNSSNINASNINNPIADLINGINFDSILANNKSIPTITPKPPPLPTADTLAELNMPIDLAPMFRSNETQSPANFTQQIRRMESPASKEVQQILSPASSIKSDRRSDANQQIQVESTEFITTLSEGVSADDITFPNKLPNVFKDLVREEQMVKIKDEMRKEMKECESRLIKTIEKFESKFNSRMNASIEQVVHNNQLQTLKLNKDIEEIRKSLQTLIKDQQQSNARSRTDSANSAKGATVADANGKEMIREDMKKDVRESELRLMQYFDKFENKVHTRINYNLDQVLANNRIQTTKLESDIREMKKELKMACKIRNEEFNKIVEKLVNKVMHEMNVIIQRGFQELMRQVNDEVKQVTTSLERTASLLNSRFEY